MWSLVRDALREFLNESPFQLAAAVSFFTLLSLSPLVLVVVGAAGLVWSQHAVRAELLAQVEQLIGPVAAQTVGTVLTNTLDPGRGALSIVIGIVTLLIGATTAFAQLQAALNRIWNVEAAPMHGVVWSLIRSRLLSLALVLVLGLLLLVSLAVSTVLATLHTYVGRTAPAGGALWQVVEFVVSWMALAILITVIFKVLPDVRIAWPDVWFGAVVTSMLFGAGKFLIGFYLGYASIAS
ncbi:MAG: YihY/virulence factor BrkB family protein, partial [Candidatus Rokuibacteriota bacterium]